MDSCMDESKFRVNNAQDLEHAEIVLSNKGGPKLIHNGFMYTLHKKQTNNIRWRCVLRTSHCRGSLVTSIDYMAPKVRMEHNHDPDYSAAKIARKRYVALGQPPVFPDNMTEEEEEQGFKEYCRDRMENGHFYDTKETQEALQSMEQTSQNVMPPTYQNISGPRTIRIAAQSLVGPQMMNIAPAPLVQQQQNQPKTLVLQTIPLKVKQVAPTTIKMPPRQPGVTVPQIVLPQQPTEVCLRWNSYHSNMQNSFPSLLDAEQFVDVTLACEGRSLKCHKMILSSCSDYLAALLRENPCHHPIIVMKDLKFWEVEALVKFMYRGEVNVAHDKLPQLLNAAEVLHVKGLAGPSPSLQNPSPPKLVPQSKPLTPNQVTPSAKVVTETKESGKPSIASVTTASSSPKRVQKHQSSEPQEQRPFTKIRLQRPVTPISPNTTVKLEPLDIPLSPMETFPDNQDENSSTASNFDNLVMALHEDEDPGGDDPCSLDGDILFCNVPGQPDDMNDAEDHMEFVPTDFLEQEQDIMEEAEGECSKSSNYEMEEDDEEIDLKRRPPDNKKKAIKIDNRGGNRKTEKCINSAKTL